MSALLYFNSKCCFQCKKKHKYVKYNIWGEKRFRGMSLSQCSWVLCCVTAGKTQGHHSVLNSFSCLMVCLTWAAHLTVSQNRNSKVDIIIYHKKKKNQDDLHLCPDTSVHRPGMISVAVHHIRRNSHHLYRYMLVENLNHQHGCHVQSLYLFHCFACLHKILSHLNPLKYFNSKTFPSHSQCATF